MTSALCIQCGNPMPGRRRGLCSESCRRKKRLGQKPQKYKLHRVRNAFPGTQYQTGKVVSKSPNEINRLVSVKTVTRGEGPLLSDVELRALGKYHPPEKDGQPGWGNPQLNEPPRKFGKPKKVKSEPEVHVTVTYDHGLIEPEWDVVRREWVDGSSISPVMRKDK